MVSEVLTLTHILPCQPFTHYFPRADIHEMLTVDLLHQIVKGCFKDMLVDWVWSYLDVEYGDEAEET